MYKILLMFLFLLGGCSIKQPHPQKIYKEIKFTISPVFVYKNPKDWIHQYHPKEVPFFGHTKDTILAGNFTYKNQLNGFVNVITYKHQTYFGSWKTKSCSKLKYKKFPQGIFLPAQCFKITFFPNTKPNTH